MKIPDIFMPKKDLGKKVFELNSEKKSDIKGINDLVIWKNSGDVFDIRDLDDTIFQAEYNTYLDLGLVDQKIMIDYENKAHAHIIKFLDKKYLESNLDGAARLIKYYSKSSLMRCHAFFKDEYLVFIHFGLLDYKEARQYYQKKYPQFINAYKNLGLEEVKNENA